MGYTTSFSGKFSITPPLDSMARIAYREAFGDESAEGPGGYNQWEVSADGSTLAWDGGEKFYDYVEWARYVSGWLKSRGSTLVGSVRWKGEDFDDIGVITATDGAVTTSGDDGPTVAIAVPERWIAAVIDREMEPEDLGRRIVGLSKGKTYPTGGRS